MPTNPEVQMLHDLTLQQIASQEQAIATMTEALDDSRAQLIAEGASPAVLAEFEHMAVQNALVAAGVQASREAVARLRPLLS